MKHDLTTKKMTQCENCGNELKVPQVALRNADTYDKTVRIVTECCGILVSVRPIRKFDISIVNSEEKEDDWGNKVWGKVK